MMAEAIQQPGPAEPQQLTFEKGQTILYEDPYAAVLATERLDKACSYCFKMLKGGVKATECKNCSKLYYCNEQCRVTDIPSHNGECIVLANISEPREEVYRLGLRLLSRVMAEKRRGEKSRTRHFGVVRTMDSFDDRIPEANEHTVALYRDHAHRIRVEYNDAHGSNVSEDDILKILFKIRLYGRSVYDSAGTYVNRLGIAMYLGFGALRHTCVPITKYSWSFSGANVSLTALEKFSVASASELEIHYISPNLSRIQRRSELSANFYFACECPRCEAEKGKQEQNMPTGLEEHMELSPIEPGWMEKAKQDYEVAQHWHPQHYYRYYLAYRLQSLCNSAQDYPAAIRYGFGALSGAIVFEEKKQIIYMLCRNMQEMEYYKSSEEDKRSFAITRAAAIDLLTTVFDKDCKLVKRLRRMGLPRVQQDPPPEAAAEEH